MINMKRENKQYLVFTLGLLMFFLILGIAGNLERTDEILYDMPNEVYVAICEKLGTKCTKYQIVSEYEKNKKYYDSIKNAHNK